MRTPIIILFFLLFCNTQKLFAQNTDETKCSLSDDSISLDQIVFRIAENNQVDIENPLPQWHRFEILEKKASKDYLIKLLDHGSPVVRVYAFKAIFDAESKNPLPLLKSLHPYLVKLYNDKSDFDCLWYDLGDTYTVSKLVRILDPFADSVIDRLFPYNGSFAIYRNEFKTNLEATAENYEIIRNYVEKYKSLDYVDILAQYRKKEDIPLIASYFCSNETAGFAVGATLHFQDDYFYPLLVKEFYRFWEGDFDNSHALNFRALALSNYTRQETWDIFNDIANCPIPDKQKRGCEAILYAIQDFPYDYWKPMEARVKLILSR